MRKYPAIPVSGSIIALISATAVNSASAGIIYYGTSSFTLNSNGQWWYLDGGSTGTIQLGSFCTSKLPTRLAFPSIAKNSFRLADSGAETVRKLALNSIVSTAKFTGSEDGSTIRWKVGSNGVNAGSDWKNFTIGEASYVGFKFTVGGATYYGWAKITILAGTGGITISEWAYEDVAGESITVGAVPEPAQAATGLGLLALGAAGLRRYRAKRKK